MESDEFSSNPDTLTMKMIVYGNKYRDVTEAFYEMDQMIDHMETENAEIMENMDLSLFSRIITMAPHILEIPEERMQPMFRDRLIGMRTYIENKEAMDELNEWKVQTDIWGKHHGALTHAARLLERGIPQKAWESSSHTMNKMSISYGSTKEVRM